MLQPNCPANVVPEETRQVAQAAFPKGNVYIWMRAEFEQLYQDADFADLYPKRGQPGWSAWRLALVCIMQYMEGLNDRQTADAVRSRIDWKYALALPLTDPGFHFSILSNFRSRLLSGEAETRLLDQALARFQQKGWLKSGGSQRTDSTHILSTMSERSRLESLHETLRATLNTLAVEGAEWLQSWVPPEWYKRYGRAVESYRLPKKQEERTVYIEQVGRDGMELLERLWQTQTPSTLRQLERVEFLRQQWVGHFFLDNGAVRLRSQSDMPRVGERSDSPYDPDSRYGNKRSTQWHGYKLHVSETCNPDEVHLITHVQTTPAPVPDIDQTAPIHAALAAKGLLPQHHFVDAGYVDTELLLVSQTDYELELVGPIKADPSWQAKTPEAYDISAFSINWATQSVTCPQGHPSRGWTEHKDPHHNRVITVNFSKPICRDCSTRSRCTRSNTYPRSLTLHHQQEQEVLQTARQQQQTESWRRRYQQRAGIEGTISQAVVGFGLRHTRYRGLAKTQFRHLACAVAINLKRLFAWVQGVPHATTRTSRFAALAPRSAVC